MAGDAGGSLLAGGQIYLVELIPDKGKAENFRALADVFSRVVRVMVQHRIHGSPYGMFVAAFYQYSVGLVDDFRNSSGSAGHDRFAAGQGFADDHGGGFVIGKEDKKTALIQQLLYFLRGNFTRKQDLPGFEMQHFGISLGFVPIPSVTRENHPEIIPY